MISRDVLIIGAGAAGSTAAFHLANLGKQVALLEKDSHISSKPCGGGMASSVQKWFPFDFQPIIEEVITKVEFTWRLSDHVEANLIDTEPFWIVRREKLDVFLRNKAINAGAEMLSPFQVISLKRKKNIWEATDINGKSIYAKSVIIADGSSSPWPKLFNLGPKNQHHASTVSVRLEGRGNLKEGSTRFEFGLVKNGFAWAFPLKNGVNIGIGSFLGKKTIVNSDEVLKKLLPSLGFDSTEGIRRESLLRIWNGHGNLHGEGILAVGDAASLCDPFLAEGLRPALMSGCEAAIYLNNWLEGEINALYDYTSVIKKKWGNSMAWGKRISHVFYRFPKVGYQLGIKRPTASKRIAQILSGEMGYGDIAQRVIKRLIFQK